MSDRFSCPEGLYGMHVERPGTGVCFLCGTRYTSARRVDSSRDVDVDDWSDPVSVDRDRDDDEAVIADELRAHKLTGRPVTFVEPPQVVKKL